ncbi:MAG: 50S ribosomal protein L13 [Candidatus Thermoplasmatota archaeon]|jgi:large subunit ribosomal protein L13|nr:50S ribosomal protein L13 [Candidatus Thermoplasmatota archaeon]
MTIIIDANGLTLGRLSTYAAKRLIKGEEIVIINSEKAIISGKKSSLKNIYKQKREVGTYRKGPYFPRTPDQIVKRTIRGMIPYQKPHGRAAFKRLKCYIGIPKEFEGKKFEIIEEAKKQPVDFITIEELSRFLGANI